MTIRATEPLPHFSFFMVSSSAVDSVLLPTPATLLFFPPPTMLLMKSMGTGKMMVEFFSAAMELRV